MGFPMFCYKFCDERLRFYESETSWFDLKKIEGGLFLFFGITAFFSQKKTPLSLSLQFDSSSPTWQVAPCCVQAVKFRSGLIMGQSRGHQPCPSGKKKHVFTMKIGGNDPIRLIFFRSGWTQQTGIQVYMLKITLLRFFVVIVGKMVHDWRFKKVFEHLCELTRGFSSLESGGWINE